MDTNIRTAIITAAVNAAGPMGEDPAEWQQKVSDAAVEITVMTSEHSAIARRLDILAECKVFVGSIVEIRKHERSTRGVLGLKTKPSQHAPDGIELVRTDRTDNPEGLAMAKKAKSLVGQRATFFVQLEQMANGQKVRVLRHIVPLGEDTQLTEDDQAAVAAFLDEKVK